MIDGALVLARGGLVLWSRTTAGPSPSPSSSSLAPASSALVARVLLEERADLAAFAVGPLALRWAFANSAGLVFVIAHQKILTLPYIDELLDALRSTFCSHFEDALASGTAALIDHLDEFASFDQVFDLVLETVEENAQTSKKTKAPRSFKESRKFATSLAGAQAQAQSKTKQIPSFSASTATTSATAAASDPSSKTADVAADGATATSPTSVADTIAAKLERLAKRGVGPRKSQPSSASSVATIKVPPSQPQQPVSASPPVKKGKQRRAWDANGLPLTGDVPQKLDFSDSTDDTVKVSTNLIGDAMGHRDADGTYDALEMDDPGESSSFQVDGDAQDGDDDTSPTSRSRSKPATAPSGGIFSIFSKWTAGRVLTAADLDAPMLKMKEHLVNKNVAADIATHLCQSVSTGLVGQRIGAFQSLTASIRDQTESALKRILTPSTSIDVLRDIHSTNRAGQPYSIVFVGVNGVGKSTNLSKVCFWLLQNHKRVLIAACDTFRSGAVEQLRVHVRNLKAVSDTGAVVDLFDRGYGKDPAGIAKEAMSFAITGQYDVVLIDTAGRMQDNEPLMRALSKLISVNNPNKIIFVGEALVGNESVDQLTKFNQALRDFSGQTSPRQIDGMIITKFDTIDDKVGAALSMTYTTGRPVLFVGTGQTYTDLKKMNVKSIVNLLLK